MNDLLELLNASGSALICSALVWVILSPKVHDGVVIKAGLICMALGFGSIALLLIGGIEPDEVLGFERALLLVNLGLAIVIVGYLWRTRRVRHPIRRSTDWSALRDTQAPDFEE